MRFKTTIRPTIHLTGQVINWTCHSGIANLSRANIEVHFLQYKCAANQQKASLCHNFGVVFVAFVIVRSNSHCPHNGSSFTILFNKSKSTTRQWQRASTRTQLHSLCSVCRFMIRTWLIISYASIQTKKLVITVIVRRWQYTSHINHNHPCSDTILIFQLVRYF